MTNQTDFTDEHFIPTAISATNPVRVTIPDHPFLPGDAIRATRFYQRPTQDSPGMEQLNDRLFYVNLVDGDDFSLFDQFGMGIDGTGYTVFVSNGNGQFTLTGPRLYVNNPAPAPPEGIPPPFSSD